MICILILKSTYKCISWCVFLQIVMLWILNPTVKDVIGYMITPPQFCFYFFNFIEVIYFITRLVNLKVLKWFITDVEVYVSLYLIYFDSCF